MKKSEKKRKFSIFENFRKIIFFEKIHTIKEDFQNLKIQNLKIFFNGVNFFKKSHFFENFQKSKFFDFSDFFIEKNTLKKYNYIYSDSKFYQESKNHT